MPTLWRGYWNILKLDAETFQLVKADRGGLIFALKLFFLVGLIVGVGKLAEIPGLFDQASQPGLLDTLAAGLESTAALLPALLAEPLTELANGLLAIQESFTQFEPPLGSGLSRLIRLIGDWLTTPLNMMAVWMGFMLAIFLVAKAMHGRASLTEHITLLTLAVAPQILAVVNLISVEVGGLDILGFLGRLLVLVAWVWSLVIVVQALAIAHEFERGQAVKVLFVFVGVVLALVILTALLGGYVLSGIF